MLPLITILSLFTAFLRDMLFAWSLGAGPASDFLWLALLLPVIFENVAGMPLRDAIIARLVGGRVRKCSPGFLVLTPIVLATLLVVLPLYLSGGRVVDWLVPGWSHDVATTAAPVFFFGLLLIPLHAAYYAQTALAAAQNRFAWSHARSVVLNLSTSVVCLLWPGQIMLILAAMLLAATIHVLLLQIQISREIQWPTQTTMPAHTPPTASLVMVLAFALLAIMQQSCVILERVFASELAAGTITYLSIAYRLATVPLAVSLGSMIVPYYVNLEAARNAPPCEFLKILRPMTQSTLWIVLPAAAVLWSCAAEIIKLLLVRGTFSSSDGQQVAAALSMYAWGLPFFCGALLMGRALLARRLINTVLVVSASSTVFYCVAGYLLHRNLDVQGLAALTSVTAVLQSALLLFVLCKHLGWHAFWKAELTNGIGLQVILVVVLALLLKWLPQRAWFMLVFIGVIWGCGYAALTWRSAPFLCAIFRRQASSNY